MLKLAYILSEQQNRILKIQYAKTGNSVNCILISMTDGSQKEFV